MKECVRCKVEKELDQFTKNKARKDNLEPVCRECVKNYYNENKQRSIKYHKKYGKENKEKILITKYKYKKHKRKTDPLWRLTERIRDSISKSFKRLGSIKPSRTEQILGCTFEQFKQHIESQFEPWMNWDNQGGQIITEINTNWDIDHKIPISSAKTKEDVIRLSHYTNFQPLCSYHNRFIKRNK